MKFLCQCGAKFALEVTPASAAIAAPFPCPACGVDRAAELNLAIREEAARLSSAASPAVPFAIPIDTPGPAPAARPVVRVNLAPPALAPSEVAAPVPPEFCSRHPGQAVATQCRACAKPICPKCMELFGYVCSPRCRETATRLGLELPAYAGQFSAVQERESRRTRLVLVVAGAMVAIVLAGWGWYEFIATKPRIAYSVRFAEAIFEGRCRFVPPRDALLLRGTRLSRHDLQAEKEVWNVELADLGPGDPLRGEEPSLHWHLAGSELWIARPGHLARLDWSTGQSAQQFSVPGRLELFAAGAGTLLVVTRSDLGRQHAWQIALPSGDVRTQEVALVPASVASKSAQPLPSVRAPGLSSPPNVGSGPAALQAARAVRIMAANRPRPDGETDNPGREIALPDFSRGEVVAGGGSLAQLNVKLLEAKSETVATMKAPPRKSAWDGPINAAATVGLVNEQLNEWQRDSTGGVQREDVSRYRVSVQRLFAGSGPGWTGEVNGPPGLYPLQSVDVVTAGKIVHVINKEGTKLWETRLVYEPAPISLAAELALDPDAQGVAPCAERDGTLFLADQGTFAAFDLATGQARWRLPSVGISALVFDGAGALYLSTTDASQDQARFAQEIDVARKVRPLILKVEQSSGRILWQARNRGRLVHADARFVYAIEWAEGRDRPQRRHVGVTPAHLRLLRLRPEDGKVLWEHFDQREPLALDFHRNQIQILFKQEMQVLKFFSF